jgi:hypothetical protein
LHDEANNLSSARNVIGGSVAFADEAARCKPSIQRFHQIHEVVGHRRALLWA